MINNLFLQQITTPLMALTQMALWVACGPYVEYTIRAGQKGRSSERSGDSCQGEDLEPMLKIFYAVTIGTIRQFDAVFKELNQFATQSDHYNLSLPPQSNTEEKVFKSAKLGLFWFIFVLFYKQEKVQTLTINGRSIDGVLGIRTRDRRLAAESTELWRLQV